MAGKEACLSVHAESPRMAVLAQNQDHTVQLLLSAVASNLSGRK